MNILRVWTAILLCSVCLAGCGQNQAAPSPAPATSPPTLTFAAPTPTRPFPTPTPTPVPSATPAPTSTSLPASQLCSPLAGYTMDELPGLVSNPYNPPPPPSDDPHHGVDLADRLPGSGIAMSGMPVQAVLPGAVAAVIINRFPYGYAVFIETPLDDLPESWLEALDLPEPLPARLINPALTCPAVPDPYYPTDRRSLYLLYAHLQTSPQVEPGQPVACARPLGAVGDTGNALNPHLHLEVRVGPSGARFASLAHYDNRASPDEMGAYCLWRVSGVFQLVDPLRLLTLEP